MARHRLDPGSTRRGALLYAMHLRFLLAAEPSLGFSTFPHEAYPRDYSTYRFLAHLRVLSLSHFGTQLKLATALAKCLHEPEAVIGGWDPAIGIVQAPRPSKDDKSSLVIPGSHQASWMGPGASWTNPIAPHKSVTRSGARQQISRSTSCLTYCPPQ